MSSPLQIRVDVHYDFASTLCYVAHRVFERIAPSLDELGLELVWTPLDLAGLLNWKRGHPVDEERRANAARVARELEVPVTAPLHWLDSRTAMALALRIESAELEASWRERIWSSTFEGGAHPRTIDAIAAAEELGIDAAATEIDAGLAELERRTRGAADATVVGAPTLMLGGWPIGGIQPDEVMLSMLTRYAASAREDAASGQPLH